MKTRLSPSERSPNRKARGVRPKRAPRDRSKSRRVSWLHRAKVLRESEGVGGWGTYDAGKVGR